MMKRNISIAFVAVATIGCYSESSISKPRGGFLPTQHPLSKFAKRVANFSISLSVLILILTVPGCFSGKEVKMVTLTYEECLAIATKKAEELSTVKSPVEIWEEKTTEKEFGWVFYPETKAFLETKDRMKRVPGISPILVNKFDSSCEIAPSSVKFETFLAEFESKFLAKDKQ